MRDRFDVSQNILMGQIVSFYFISDFFLVSPTTNYSQSILKLCPNNSYHLIDLKKWDIKHTSEWTWEGLEICVLEKNFCAQRNFLLALFLNITHERNQQQQQIRKRDP